MNSNTTTQGLSGAAYGGAGAAVVIFVWILSMFNIVPPGEVVAAMSVLAGIVAHYFAVALAPKSTVNVPVEASPMSVAVPVSTIPTDVAQPVPLAKLGTIKA